MRVFICGIDGYLGWSLACHLAERGHVVDGLDAGHRRRWVAQVGGCSAIPIPDKHARFKVAQEHWDKNGNYPPHLNSGDMTDYEFLLSELRRFEPDTIVHLAEQPSAPFSMKDQAHSVLTHNNNVIGSLNLLWAMRTACPKAHLVKLGTMGEYGTPNSEIPEGVFPENSYWVVDLGEDMPVRGRLDGMMFPRSAGSYYHQTKVHDTNNTAFACKMWGLLATDIMQGVVYGTRIDAFGDNPDLRTRFDFDECFGTVINRFCAQAVIGYPLTIYGSGGQTRGYLPLRDSIQCFTRVIEAPPQSGYHTINQFDQTYSVKDLAEAVQKACKELSISVQAVQVDNPRIEAEQHDYKPDNQKLIDLGYKPTGDLHGQLIEMLADLQPHADRIREHAECIKPKTKWGIQSKYAI